VRLSEAIMLGSTMGLKVQNTSWRSCLIGIGISAIGKDNIGNVEALARYPWLNQSYEVPSIAASGWFAAGKPYQARSIITEMATKVELGEITIEQAVDWIRSVEPREEPCPESVQAEPSLATDLAQVR